MVRVGIICDGCGKEPKIMGVEKTLGQGYGFAVKAAKEAGWVVEETDHIVCPDCQEWAEAGMSDGTG